MTDKTAAGAATEVAADDFDAAFAEAVASVGTGAPATGKPVDGDAAATAATNAQVDADEEDAAGAAGKAAADAAAKVAADKTAADAAAKAAADKVVTDAAEKVAADKVAADEKAAADKATADAAAKAIADAGKTPEEIAAATAAADKATADAAARKLAEDVARKLADETAAKAASDKAAADKVEADRKAAEAAEIKDPVLSEDQTKAIENFEKEWPDVAAAVKVQQTHLIAGVEARFARALTAIVQKIYDDIGPIAQTVANVETNTYRAGVLKAHPDYDAIEPKILGWIESQPAYLTDVYKKVYNDGSLQDFTDLVKRYKEANGIVAQTLETPVVPVTPTDQSSAASKAAAAKKAAELAPVSGKRTTPAPQSQDPQDYDGAFAEAAALYVK